MTANVKHIKSKRFRSTNILSYKDVEMAKL